MANFINKIILLSYNKKMEILKMSSRGQIVIPQRIRKDLQLDEGAIIGIEKINDVAVLKKIDTELVVQFKKSLTSLKTGKVRKLA